MRSRIVSESWSLTFTTAGRPNAFVHELVHVLLLLRLDFTDMLQVICPPVNKELEVAPCEGSKARWQDAMAAPAATWRDSEHDLTEQTPELEPAHLRGAVACLSRSFDRSKYSCHRARLASHEIPGDLLDCLEQVEQDAFHFEERDSEVELSVAAY